MSWWSLPTATAGAITYPSSWCGCRQASCRRRAGCSAGAPRGTGRRAMGKLVLFLADGTTLDIPLEGDRISIGRRAKCDVCLPYPAVSAEHAVVVPVAAGAVIED